MVYLPVVLISSAVLAGVSQVNRRKKGSDAADKNHHGHHASHSHNHHHHRHGKRRSSSSGYYYDDEFEAERTSDELAAYARNSIPFPGASSSSSSPRNKHRRPYGQLLLENGESAVSSGRGSSAATPESSRRGSSMSHSSHENPSFNRKSRSRHMSESQIEPFRGRAGGSARHFEQFQTERRSSNQETATSRPYYVTYPSTGVSKATARGSHSRMKSPRDRWHVTSDHAVDSGHSSSLSRRDSPMDQNSSMVPYKPPPPPPPPPPPQQTNSNANQPSPPPIHLFESDTYSPRDFTRIWGSKHRIYADGDYVPILKMRHLGQKSSSVVEAVQHPKLPGLVLVHKYSHIDNRPDPIHHVQKLRSQTKKWSKLEHTHITTLLGTYETGISFSTLTYPACQGNLGSLLNSLGGKQLDEIDPRSELDLAVQFIWLKKWFGCLASALDYMHEQEVCHFNIKPENVLYRNDCVYLTDFGVEMPFSKFDGEGRDSPIWSTKRYAAPELVITPATHPSPTTATKLPPPPPPHTSFSSPSPPLSLEATTSLTGPQSDIFSLGCIYLEMLAVIQGHSISNFHWFLNNSFTQSPTFNTNTLNPVPSQNSPTTFSSHNQYPPQPQPFIYSQVYPGVCDYFTHGNMTYDTMFEQGIKPMIALQGRERPSAKEVMGLLVRYQPWERVDCGCCSFGMERVESRKGELSAMM